MFKKNINLEKNIKKKLEEGMVKAASVLQDKIKDNLSGPKTNKKLGVRTGNLRKSIKIDESDKSNLTVRVGTSVNYAKIHEFGGVIKAKTADKLKFKIKNKWHTAKSVIINARPYFRPAIKQSKKRMLKEFKNII